jgi:hypothetical protein
MKSSNKILQKEQRIAEIMAGIQKELAKAP